MASQLETVSGLERRLTLNVPPEDVAAKVQQRLRGIARTARAPGFRPGKVPLKMIEQSYGPQVRAEEFGNAVTAAFSNAVQEHSLRVAGQPRIEPVESTSKGESVDGTPSQVTALFEVYPEFQVRSPAEVSVTRYSAQVGDAEIDRTVDILRRQRTSYSQVEREAADGDRVTLDFAGKVEGVAFDGGTAQDFTFNVGEGRMLTDFEAGVRGMKPGEHRTIDVAFPEDYGNKALAGKTAQFDLDVKGVEEPKVPEVDADFVKAMGVEDGDIERFRSDVRANIDREVAQRLRQRTKTDAMDKLLELAEVDVPKALVEQESEAMAERMRADLTGRGIDVAKLPVPADAFTEKAQRRVKLGLIVGEIVKANELAAKPEQIRAQIEEFAQAYDNPGEVIRWYFSDRQRLAEVEALVVEQNVVDWMLGNGKVEEKVLSFEELMSGAGTSAPQDGVSPE